MKIKIILLFIFIFCFIFLIISFVWSSILIGNSVKQYCQIAKAKYQNNYCADSLILFLEDENNPLSEKNHIVWAIGQLGDKKALPVLQKYYTGAECDHEKYLCQYELKKAIKLLDGSFNATAFIWRHNID